MVETRGNVGLLANPEEETFCVFHVYVTAGKGALIRFSEFGLAYMFFSESNIDESRHYKHSHAIL